MGRWLKFGLRVVLVAWLLMLSVPWTAPAVIDDLDETNLLSPIDTSNPRATLVGFMEESRLAHQLVLEADQQTRRTPGLRHSAPVREKGRIAEVRMRRAMRYIDLTHIPLAQRFRRGLRSAVLLHEVLSRITLPPVETIPATPENSVGRVEVFPGIEVVRITEGYRSGEYLFTRQTVARLETIYRILKQLVPRPAQEDFYQFYYSTPGQLLPPKWSYWLPDWTLVVIWQQTLWQWLFLFCAILMAVGIYWLVHRLQQWDTAATHSVRKAWEGLIDPTTVLILIAFVSHVQYEINITGSLDDFLITTQGVLFFGALSWLLFMLMNAIGRTLIVAPHFTHKPLETVMIRNGFRMVGGLVAVTTLYTGFRQLGFDVAPMLAGIGAGSLALSLGIQPYIKNLIGGINLLVNRTVKIGELCQIGGIRGVIEDIGLTATRLRTADRSLVTLPNVSIVEQQIINYSRRDRYVFTEEFTLKRLPDDNIDIRIQELKQVLMTAPLLAQTQVSLVDLTPYYMTVSVTADVLTTDAETYEGIHRELLQRLQSVA